HPMLIVKKPKPTHDPWSKSKEEEGYISNHDIYIKVEALKRHVSNLPKSYERAWESIKEKVGRLESQAIGIYEDIKTPDDYDQRLRFDPYNRSARGTIQKKRREATDAINAIGEEIQEMAKSADDEALSRFFWSLKGRARRTTVSGLVLALL